MSIGGFIGKVFGTDAAIQTTVNAVKDGLDALVYTEEEKATTAAADRAAARSMVVEWMQATSGQNLARRWLAIVITTGWLAQYGSANLFAVIAVFVKEPLSQQMLAASGIMGGYANQMNGAVMLILAFYFAAPHMGQIVDAAMSRFGKPPTPAKEQ